VCREFARVGLCDHKNQARGKDGHLEQATAFAAEGCGSVREGIKNPSSVIRCNRKKIDNRSQQRNYASARPMINSQQAKSLRSHQRHE
jgi:hypothetical protein